MVLLLSKANGILPLVLLGQNNSLVIGCLNIQKESVTVIVIIILSCVWYVVGANAVTVF